MGKIDTSGWKEFRVGDLFAQERGKEKAPKQNEPGDCPLIQETNNNNGFDRMVVPTKIIKGNSITVSINYAQNVFYQAEDFCASVNIAVLRNSHLNRYNSQFVCSVLRNAHQKFDYTSKISKELLNKEMIMLPVDKTGQPDWAYMESYMANLETKVAESLTMLQAAKDAEKKKVDTKEWGEFRVGELFDAERGKVKNIQPLTPGATPIIAAGAYNQGIAGMYDIDSAYKNRITVSCNGAGCGSTFYHPYEFNVNGDAITLIEKKCMSDRAKQFVACILNATFTRKFSYEEKCSPQKALAEAMRLPMDKTGQPDWAYMKEYMRKVERKTEGMLNQFISA